jgi:hypothetical protein
MTSSLVNTQRLQSSGPESAARRRTKAGATAEESLDKAAVVRHRGRPDHAHRLWKSLRDFTSAMVARVLSNLMYVLAVLLHSVIRWVVIALGIVAVYRAVNGQSGRRPWTSSDANISLGFTAALDLQLLIGLLLFVFSPITILGMHELDLAVKSPTLRFWTFEHPVLMVAAIVLAHVARIRIRRHAEPSRRHRTAAVFFGLALLLVLAGNPWPFLSYGRPLLSWVR